MMPKQLIVIIGPTAIGKTRLSLALASHFDSEIIAADSRQFYKEMRIGTAVPTSEELATTQHHFIQHIGIQEPYSVGDFEKEAMQRIGLLFERYDTLVMVGGSGLYINAITQGLDTFPTVKGSIKQQVQALYNSGDIPALQQRLKQLDPTYYQQVDLQNTQRLIRALEVSLSSGQPYSSFRTQKKKKRPFEIIKIGLSSDRPILYERINTRVDQMIADGLIQEAESLYDYRQLNALNTVGYKELFRYFEGQYDREFAIAEIKKNTRRFAKRQLTWFRKETAVHWFDFQTPTNTIIASLKKES